MRVSRGSTLRQIGRLLDIFNLVTGTCQEPFHAIRIPNKLNSQKMGRPLLVFVDGLDLRELVEKPETDQTDDPAYQFLD